MKESADNERYIADVTHKNKQITYLAASKHHNTPSPPCRFCKQRLLKYDLVSTVSVYSKSERKKKTLTDHI